MSICHMCASLIGTHVTGKLLSFHPPQLVQKRQAIEMCPCWRNYFKFLVFRELVTECLIRVKPNLKPLLEYRNTRCFVCDMSDQLSRGAEGAMGKCAPKVKVKFILEQATKTQRGSRCIALLFL
jgi:hypothetical protein